MTHYDELRSMYAEYKTKSHDLDLERRTLPAVLAEGFGAFLGCPPVFVEPSTKKHQKYVLPAVATQVASPTGSINLLRPYNPISEGLPNLQQAEDGRFYFGVCVFLEFSEQIFPKEAFGILLSAKSLGAKHLFNVRLHISGDEYKISSRDMNANIHLYDRLMEIIKKSLSGMKIEYEPKQGIGFVKFRHDADEG